MKFFIWMLIVVLFLGCASHLPTQIDRVASSQNVEYVYMKQTNKPTVIFENGLGATYDYWDKVIPEVSKNATVYAYNRAGYGKSTASSNRRDGETIINELRSNLSDKGIKPPYILVGHSLGGLYVQYFARHYPNEVQALVLVDSTHPNQLKGDGAYANWPWWYRQFFTLLASQTVKKEFERIDELGAKTLELPMPNIPVIILSADESNASSSDLAKDVHAKRKDFKNLYPNAKQIWVESGHMIQVEKPEVVIGAILEVINNTKRACD